MSVSDCDSDFHELLALATTIHSEWLAISDFLLNSLIAKMGATPIWNLVIAMSLSQSLMQMLTVIAPVNLHCTQNKSLSQSESQSPTVNRP